MKPQKFIVTVTSPSGHGDWAEKFQRILQLYFLQFGYDKTTVEVKEIVDTESENPSSS